MNSSSPDRSHTNGGFHEHHPRLAERNEQQAFVRVGSSTGFLQEKVYHLEICLDVAGTHEGQGRGRSRSGRSEDASFLGVREREERTSARLPLLLGQAPTG